MKNIRKGVSLFVLCLVILVTISSLPRIQSAIDESDFAPMKSQSTGTSISNFDDFTKLNESAHITSTKSSSEISFAFNGSTSSWVTERYIYAIDTGSYCEDFSVQATIDYSFADIDDMTAVGMIIGSNYDGNNNYIGQPEILGDQVYGYTSVYDAWADDQAVHKVLISNNSISDDLFDAYGSAGLSGTVLINQTRKDGSWTCSVTDSSGSTTYVTKNWLNVNQEVNYIIIFYNSQKSYSDTSATVSSITGNLDIVRSNYDLVITDFQDFSIYEDESTISSVNGDSYISFNYNGGSSTADLTEAYVLPLDTYGNCDYFDILIRFNYTTTADDDLVEMKLKLGSYYNFQGMYIGKDYANGNNVFYSGGVWDAWASNQRKYFVGCKPYDVWEQYNTSDNSLPYSGDITEHLIRNESGLFVELYDTVTNNTILNHNWTDGIDKSVNYLYIEFQSGTTNSQAEAIAYEISGELNFTQEMGVSLKWSFPTSGELFYSDPLLIDIDRDNEIEILFGSTDSFLYCLSANGSLEWSFQANNSIQTSPLAADLDKDGFLEVIFGSSDEYVYCLTSAGSLVWGYKLDGSVYDQIAIADIDNNGNLEIVVGSSNYSLYCLNWDGSLKWHKGGAIVYEDFSPVIADLDKDGQLEIISIGAIDIFCLNSLGNIIWSYAYAMGLDVGTAAIGDMNNDDKLDVVYYFSSQDVVCLHYNGTFMWNRTINEQFSMSPAIADLDSDGNLEVLVSTKGNHLYCLNNLGEILWIHSDTSHLTPPSVSDLNNDGFLEILAGVSYSNKIICLNYTGSLLWNYSVSGNLFGSVSIADIDNDNISELVFGCRDYNVYCLDVNNVGSSKGQWFRFHGSNANTGQYDSDSDFLDDVSEDYYSLNASNPDCDSDGLLDGLEIMYNTNPISNDTDSDLLLDGDEVYIYNTSPVSNDTDFDSLLDGDEVYIYNTDPTTSDTDSDGLDDLEEITLGSDGYITDATESDTDSDGLGDLEEVTIGADGFLTNPNDPDSDNDGLTDGEEVNTYSTNPLNADSDSDLLTDGEEINIYQTNPNSADSDNDNLSDFEEVNVGIDGFITDPNDSDSDEDNISDGDEVLGIYEPDNPYANSSGYLFTNPLSNDTDQDGILDFEEVFEGIDGYWTNPNNADSDSDMIPDKWEVDNLLDPNTHDSYLDYDNDGLDNLDEYNWGTNPRNADTDGDGFKDGEEVKKGSHPNNANDHPSFHNWTIGVMIVSVFIAIILAVLLSIYLRKNMPAVKSKLTKQKKLRVAKQKAIQKQREIAAFEKQKEREKAAEERRKEREKIAAEKQKAKEKAEAERKTIREKAERERLAQRATPEDKREENLKKIIKSYSRISLKLMAELLEFRNVLDLQKWIIDLPGEKLFYIEGSEVVIPRDLKGDRLEKVVQSLDQVKHNTCFHCGYPLESDTKTCPECKKKQLFCTVCKLPISFGEEIGKCSLCEAQGHIAHMQEWVKIQGKCPKCLQFLPVEGIVPEELTKEKK